MKATIEIQEKSIEVFFKDLIDEKLLAKKLDTIVEKKIENKVDEILKNNLSNEKIENFARDRISRIITSNSLNKIEVNGSDVLSNLESKILLMIKHSNEFKKLVRDTLKNSL